VKVVSFVATDFYLTPDLVESFLKRQQE